MFTVLRCLFPLLSSSSTAISSHALMSASIAPSLTRRARRNEWVLGEREVHVGYFSRVPTEAFSLFQKPEPKHRSFLNQRGTLGTQQIQLESLILAQNER